MSAPRVGVEIVSTAGVPELRVDGIPFFLHGAQFDYFRIPPDLWSQSLNRYRDLGINTIDLRIPWNWHEPRDGEFDFDGHTNPRRNLRGLLRLIAEKHFRIVAHPGPSIGDHWRNSGYPAWLLAYSEYKMNAHDRDAGLPPPDAELALHDGNAAARDWLSNDMHMSYARRWLTSVAKELAPYISKNTFEITEPGDREGEGHIQEIGGPLLFVELDDATAVRPGSDTAHLSRYLSELRGALAHGGLDALSFIDVPDIAAQGIAAKPTPSAMQRVGLTSEWLFKPATERAELNSAWPVRAEVSSVSSHESYRLAPSDASALSSLAASLTAQANFPPLLSSFAATTFAPADDVRAVQPPPENMLLASRILLGGGLRGITYTPLQDTITPAGWGTPSAARYFRWDSAFDLAGNRGPRAYAVARNGKFISAWGAMLASSHARADSAIADTRDTDGPSGPDPNVIVTELISNETAMGTAARPQACVEGQLCAAMLVSVTNLNWDTSATESFAIPDPRPTAPKSASSRIAFDVTVPPHDSLMLPAHAPLCSAVSASELCGDEVISAGAELLGAEREGKTLELKFYAPARATVLLRLESQPSKVELDDDIRLDSDWKHESNALEVSVPRGASPNYFRVLKIHLRYTPHVNEKPDPARKHHGTVEHEASNAMRFPIASDASIPTGPPLIPTGPGAGGQLLLTSRNRGDTDRGVDFALDGAFHGSDSTRVYPDDQQYTRIRLQPGHSSATADAPAAATTDGLLHGQLSIHSGHEGGSLPILFVPPLENGNAHYQNDFDRDGSPEWVLESERLRLIVSPADAGQALALVDKSSNENLITLGGALHDLLAPSGDPTGQSRASADFSANAAYRAAWIEQEQGTTLQLTYSAHEHSMAGLHVEKTLRLAAPETVEAAYRVSLGALGTDAPAASIGPPRIFISRLSVPAYSPAQAEDGQTSFCWQPPVSTVSVMSLAVPGKSANNAHCEEFSPSGPPIAIPAGIARLEIRSPNRHVLAVEWTSAQATIVPKKFSAQLEFAIPAPPPGAVPAEFTLRYTVGDMQP